MMNSIINKKRLFTLLGILGLFLIWIIASILVDNEIVLPKFKSVLLSLWTLLKDLQTYKIILFTLLRVILSLLIGGAIGIFLAVMANLFPSLHYFLSPYIKIMRSIPIVSIILIVLILFGNTNLGDFSISPILITLLLVTPLFYEVIYSGIKNIDSTLIDLTKEYNISKKTLAFKVYLPMVRKEMFVAISQSTGLAFKAMVMAEYISQVHISIGYAISSSRVWLDYASVYSWTIILILIALLLEFITKKCLKVKA